MYTPRGGQLLRLRAARETVSQENGIGIRIVQRGQQAGVGNLHRYIVMSFLHAEVTGQTAAARHFSQLGSRRAQKLLVRSPSHYRVMVTVRLGHYLDSVPGHVDVEQTVRAELDLPDPDAPERPVPLTLAGRIDRLEHLGTPGTARPRVRLIDLKTGKSVSAAPARHPQLAAYREALEATGYEVDGAALVLLGKEPPKKNQGLPVLAPVGAALDPSPDPETGEDWARVLLARAAKAASASSLVARTGELCRSCAVKDSCPVQSEGRRTVS